jgi:dynein heavy chain
MLDWLTNQVKDYLKFIPLIRVFSNPGMKERHWTQVSEYTHFPVNPDQNLLIRKLVEIDEIFDKLPDLELIAENAEKEFGIEKIIRKMEDDWEPVNVELKKWRDTGTYIVAGSSID